MDLSPIGTAEDLFALFARREYQALGQPPYKGPLARGLVEPALQAFGRAVAEAVDLLPAGASLALQDRLYRVAQGTPDEPTVRADDPELVQAAALAREAERRSGRRAAVACLFSHAPVEKEWLHLNPLMFRSALKGLAAVRGGPCRPRLINAVDAFALDMLPAFDEGAYAGFMSAIHLGFLRVVRARPAMGRVFTRGAGWDRIALKTVRLLAGGGELLMVLAGGVPSTARGYYALREAVGRLCRGSPSAADPRAALERLAAREPSFAAFRGSGEVGGLKSAWRLFEAWVLDLAMSRAGRAALMAGRLDPAAAAALVAVANALRVPAPEFSAARKVLEAELERETPFRRRFLSLAARRVAGRGRPLLLLPLGWGRHGAVKVAFGPPACLLPAPPGKVLLLGPDGNVEESTPEDFARPFVSPRFP